VRFVVIFDLRKPSSINDESSRSKPRPIPSKIALKECDKNFETVHRLVHVGGLGLPKGIVYHLVIDERVLGMPRLVFIMLAGCICVALIACATFTFAHIQARRKNNKYYSFSLLPQKADGKRLFEDDEHDETELFRSPIKGKHFS
jgi:hypothetical protein